jgi:lipopolysaccharide/colanic/teichoic acid biosynthesis glycosyltransferase
MEKFLQKELGINQEISIPGLIVNNIINENFDIIKLKNSANLGLNIICDFEKRLEIIDPRSVDIVLIEKIKKRDLNKKLSLSYEKLKNGGYLILNISKVKIPKIELAGMMMYYGLEKKGILAFNSGRSVIARKLFEKSKIKKPSTSFFISLDRVGFDGKNIKIHKIRSMYKYSEFLHQGMLNNSELSNIGKIKEDPRVTTIGKFMRKYWIDELPQLLDLLTCKIKFVGIRAMSYAFFSKYPERYKKKYYKVKPGLICPILDEETAGFDEIVKIEEEYLDDYIKNPLITDIKLFFSTLAMILKGTRSK